MKRLDEVRARAKQKSVYSEAMAVDDRAYLLSLIDEIAAKRDEWRETVLRCDSFSDYARTSALSDCADKLTEILKRDEP